MAYGACSNCGCAREECECGDRSASERVKRITTNNNQLDHLFYVLPSAEEEMDEMDD